MTKEQIREKADKFISTQASGMPKEMDYYVNILTEFATEVTKELEKENANLKALRKYELNVAKLEIEKLEQENASLKARLSVINLLTPELEKVSKLRKQQLTKAKELLTRFVMASVHFNGRETDLVEEAKQFISG